VVTLGASAQLPNHNIFTCPVLICRPLSPRHRSWRQHEGQPQPHCAAAAYLTLTSIQTLSPALLSAPAACDSPFQIVAAALQYFKLHFPDPISNADLAQALAITEECLEFSFARIRGTTVNQALQDLRLNKLFTSLTDQPRQALRRAVWACGLGETAGVLPLFEQTFGIAMPLFLRTCRRAADDRLFRRDHPEAAALVLPT
jgi:AraC-like DNA-binding protein